MSWNWTKFGWIAGGFLLGTYGVRLLGSRDMKKAYTHTTAAVLRMKDEVVKDFTVIGENCADIGAAAKDINEARAEASQMRRQRKKRKCPSAAGRLPDRWEVRCDDG